MRRFFTQLYDYLSVRPKTFWVVLTGLIVLCAAAASQITFEEDISNIFGFNEKTREYTHIVNNSKTTDRIVVRIYPQHDTLTADTGLMIELADSLATLLRQACGHRLSGIKAQVDFHDVRHLSGIIAQHFPLFIRQQGHYPQYLDSMFTGATIHARLDASLNLLSTPGGFVMSGIFRHDPLGFSGPLFAQLGQWQATAQFEIFNDHIFTKDHNNILLMLYPAVRGTETMHNGILVSAIDKTVEQFGDSELCRGYNIQYFGSAVVAVGNARQLQKDTLLSMSLAVITLLLLIIVLFRKKRIPLLILLTVSFGLLFALAVISLLKGAISLIAIGTGAVILGVVINYPIHFFTHLSHNKNVRATINDMVTPMTIGSLTTIGGFFCLMFTNSQLLKDMGIFGACCLIGSALFSLIFLPHLTGNAEAYEGKSNAIQRFFERINRRGLDKSKAAVILVIAATPVLFYFSFDVGFDNNLDHFNYMPDKTRQAENDFLRLPGGGKSIYFIAHGSTREEAMDNTYKHALWTDSVCRSNGYPCQMMNLCALVPPGRIQQARAQEWNSYWQSDNGKAKRQLVEKLFHESRLDTAAFGSFFTQLHGQTPVLSGNDYDYLLNELGEDLIFEGDSIYTVLSQVATDTAYIGSLLQALNDAPYAVVLNKRFITEQLGDTINSDFTLISWLTAILVFVALLLAYGRIELALIAFTPMIVSWVWILGLMGLLGLQFNIINIVLSTFIFGLGDDFCIFTLDAHLNEYVRKKQLSATVRMSVMIAGLTSLIGLGALFLAKHPALFSLATISILGIISVLVISQILEPLLFRLYIANPAAKQRAPVSMLTLINTVFTFSFFIICSISLSILALSLFVVPGLRKARKKILHHLIHLHIRALVYGAFVVKKIKVNSAGEDFKKPAVIICNHQSMLDILYLLTLTPNMVLVVKRWVWNSPVMGPLVRIAGFHTIEEGVENNLDKYRATVSEGYSIAVFPEGSRSPDGNIKRFHKGAFYLAEQLQLDIIPIMIQHTRDTLPKGSFSVRPQQMSMKIYPRISHEDVTFGENYASRTKSIQAWYRHELPAWTKESRGHRYFFRNIKDAYMFRGPVVEGYLRCKIPLENYYKAFEQLVPGQGSITDLGCGYGFMSYWLWMKSGQRRITAYDYDEEKIDIAHHCYMNNGNINFIAADITKVDIAPADCFILSDTLHYLSAEEQKRLIRRIAGKINPGGSIIIRDADKNQKERMRYNRIMEFISTKLTGFNKTSSPLSFISFNEWITLAGSMGLQVAIIDNPYLSTNKILVLKNEL